MDPCVCFLNPVFASPCLTEVKHKEVQLGFLLGNSEETHAHKMSNNDNDAKKVGLPKVALHKRRLKQ